MGRFKPAVFGGILIGVLSGLPVVSAGNVCCCLWVICGGILATYLLQQQNPNPVETSDAAVQGLVAGLIGALIACIFKFALLSVMAPVANEAVQRALEQNPQIPPEWRDFIVSMSTGNRAMLLSVAITVPIYAIFGTLGSLLGLAFFRKKTPPVAPPAA
jgi:hypothetical protein